MSNKIFSFSLVPSLLFLVTIVFAISPRPIQAADGWALIDCYCEGDNVFTSIGESDKERNVLETGNKLTWLMVGPENTKVTIEFVQQDNCPGTDPFEEHLPFEGEIKNSGKKFDKIVSSKIAANMAGPDKCYGYKVTCSNHAATQTAPGDPIIEVPR